jgi:hypothetical protein
MKIKILIGIIVILLICASCELVGPRRPGDTEPEVVEYHKGTDGLVLEIREGRPPKKIWPESEFIIEVILRNKGAYDIKSGKVNLHGFNPRYVVPSESKDRIDIMHGRSPGYPEGDLAVIQFDETNILAPPGKEALSFTVSAEYDYATELGEEVCVSPELNPIVKTKETICEVKEISLTSQGAPVAFTKINELPSFKAGKLNLKFIFDIENKGKGEILGNITLSDVSLGGRPLSCDEDTFKLNEDTKTEKIKCEIDIDRPTGPYLSFIFAKLSYEYKTKLDGKIDIIK